MFFKHLTIWHVPTGILETLCESERTFIRDLLWRDWEKDIWPLQRCQRISNHGVITVNRPLCFWEENGKVSEWPCHSVKWGNHVGKLVSSNAFCSSGWTTLVGNALTDHKTWWWWQRSIYRWRLCFHWKDRRESGPVISNTPMATLLNLILQAMQFSKMQASIFQECHVSSSLSHRDLENCLTDDESNRETRFTRLCHQIQVPGDRAIIEEGVNQSQGRCEQRTRDKADLKFQLAFARVMEKLTRCL